jgi:hypothetical protein
METLQTIQLSRRYPHARLPVKILLPDYLIEGFRNFDLI